MGTRKITQYDHQCDFCGSTVSTTDSAWPAGWSAVLRPCLFGEDPGDEDLACNTCVAKIQNFFGQLRGGEQ